MLLLTITPHLLTQLSGTSVKRVFLLLFLFAVSFTSYAQVSFTESFETDTAGLYFGGNGQAFRLVNKLRVSAENPAIPSSTGHGVGAGGLGVSNRFINNNCAGCNTTNTSYITTADGNAFRLSSLYFFASARIAGDTPTSGGGVIFRGKLNGNTVFQLYKSNGWPVSHTAFNGYSFFDFATCNTWTDSSTQNNVTTVSIDSLEIELTGGFVYEAIDLFTWKKSPPVVSSLAPPLIGGTSVLLKGNVSNPGSSAVSGRGFIYNTSPGLLAGIWIPSGSGRGIFNDTAKLLLPNTTYYYRAYAINAQDTSYGSELSFTTAQVLSSVIDSINVTCFGMANGTASVTVSGGCPTYKYLWSPSGKTTATISNLAPGTYTCTITDSLGIQIQKTTSVIQPAAFSNNIITSTGQSICYGSATTAFTAGMPSGGGGSGGGYTYKWISATVDVPGNYAAASGTNDTAGYYAGTRTQTTWFRRVVKTATCADTSNAVVVSVTQPVFNNSFSVLPSAVCSGSPVSIQLWGSTPQGGSGSYSYSWESSVSSGTAGFTPMGSSNIYFSGVVTLAQKTWYRRKVISGACSNTSAVEFINVNPGVGSNTITSGNQQVCSNVSGTIITASTPSGGNGTFTYNWLSSTTSATTGFANASGTRTGQNYTPGTRTVTTWFRRLVSSGGCSDTSAAIEITVGPKPTNSLSFGSTICPRNSVAYTPAAPTGGNGTYTFLWLSSSTGNAGSYSPAAGANTGQSYTTEPLIASTWYRRIVYSGVCTDTSVASKTTVNNTNTWNASVSNAWDNPLNWSCAAVPDSVHDVQIYSFTTPPVVSNAQTCRAINITGNGRLILNSSNSSLRIFGNFITSGGNDTPLIQMAGQIIFGGSTLQTIGNGAFSKVVIDNPAGVKLAYNIKVSDTIRFVQGHLFLDYYQLDLTGTQSCFVNASADKHVVSTNAAMRLQRLGTGGRMGGVEIPIGKSASSYTPITLTNAGVADNFYIRVLDSVYQDGAYIGTSALTQKTVNFRYHIYEDVSGGSNLTAKVTWNAAEELPLFNRSQAYITYYRFFPAPSGWTPGPPTAATGSGPYSITRSGISGFNGDIYLTVASEGVLLPVELLRFDVSRLNEKALLSWSTASELNNSHFTVQRSVDQTNYENVVAIKGKGSTLSVSHYSYTDENALAFSKRNNSSVVYYRLAQTDNDGKIQYSHLHPLNFDPVEESRLTVYPNPFNDHAFVRITGTNGNDHISYHLTDLSGRLVSSGSIESADIETLFDVNALCRNIESGIFFLAVQYGANRQIVKINKLK